MTFMQWYKQTARECSSEGVPAELVKHVLVMAIRVALEEFMANPADADLDIKGIGRFYLNRRICHNNFYGLGEGKEYEPKWTIQFKPSIRLKDTLNGKWDIRKLVIGSVIPLYPEYAYKDGTKAFGSGKKFKGKVNVRQFKVKTTKKYIEAVKKAEKKMLEEKLPEVEDGE